MVAIDERPRSGQVRNSNAAMLAACVERDGAQIVFMEHAPDSDAPLRATLQRASACSDLVITTAAAARAAAAHTGALTGSGAVLDAFERCGVLRVDTLGAPFSMARVLAKQPRPAGNRLAIATNAGGRGSVACRETKTTKGRPDRGRFQIHWARSPDWPEAA